MVETAKKADVSARCFCEATESISYFLSTCLCPIMFTRNLNTHFELTRHIMISLNQDLITEDC